MATAEDSFKGRLAKDYIKWGNASFDNYRPAGRTLSAQPDWSEEELNYICSEACLRYQGGATLPERAAEISCLYGKEMNAKTLRQLYKGQNINERIVRKRLGGPNLGSIEEQQEDIEHIAEKVGKVLSQGRLLFFLDETVFSGEDIPAGRKVWTNSSKPLRLKPGVSGGKYVSLLGAASAQNGAFHWELKEGSGMKKEDIVEFLAKLRKGYGPTTPLAVFLDNASCHKANVVKAAANDLGIALIYNLPYRADLNGIENVWVHVKASYRTKKVKHLMAGVSWSNKDLVIEVLRDLEPKTIKAAIIRG